MQARLHPQWSKAELPITRITQTTADPKGFVKTLSAEIGAVCEIVTSARAPCEAESNREGLPLRDLRSIESDDAPVLQQASACVRAHEDVHTIAQWKCELSVGWNC